MKIGLDIMSGDNGPLSNIKGAINFLNNPKSKDTNIILYGNENIYKNNKSLIDKYKERLKFTFTKHIISMNDKPSIAFRKKRDSSLIKIIDDINENVIDACISSGNTGALLTSGLLILGKINGVGRPALAPFIPIGKKGFLLCDAGANSNIKPSHLVQFGLMCTAYIENLNQISKPRIALLNIGSEENKGNKLTIEAYPLLKENLNNFIGNIESSELFKNKADIILCDGFTGNIVLKLIEGLVKNMIETTKKSVDSHSISKFIKPVLYPVFSDISKSLDHEEHGGTPILGINGIVMKCHGSSTSKAIENALYKTQQTYETKLIEKFEKKLQKINVNTSNE